MARPPTTSIADHFRTLPDPSVRRTHRHALVDILVITLCAAICGADDWVAIARFGRAKPYIPHIADGSPCDFPAAHDRVA